MFLYFCRQGRLLWPCSSHVFQWKTPLKYFCLISEAGMNPDTCFFEENHICICMLVLACVYVCMCAYVPVRACVGARFNACPGPCILCPAV